MKKSLKYRLTSLSLLAKGCLFALLISGQAFAKAPSMSQEEYRSSICAIASQGAFIVAVERQKGSSKKQAKVRVDLALADLKKQFHSPTFLKRISETWYADLDRIYRMDILKTPEEKSAFASILEEMSYSACMGKQPSIAF